MKKSIYTSVIVLLSFILQAAAPAWAGECWYLPKENWTAKGLMFANAYGDGIDHTPADDAAGNHWYDNAYDDSAWGDIVGSLDASDGTWKAGEKGMYYIRRHFTIDDLTKSYILSWRFYDYGVIYINGRSIQSGSYFWSYCTSFIDADRLQEGDNVIAVYVTDYDGGDMFLDFGIYEEVQPFTIGDLEYEFNTPNSVKLIRGTNENINTLIIPEYIDYNEKQLSITAIGENAFQKCITLESVVIPDNVISIGNNAFESCINIEKLILGNSVQIIGVGVFKGCDKISDLKIPSSVKEIGDGALPHSSNSRLNILTIEDSTEPLLIGTSLGGPSLDGTSIDAVLYRYPKECYIGRNLEFKSWENGSAATLGYYQNGSGKITFGNYVTDICDYHFCFGQFKISELPKNLKTIGKYAFYGYNEELNIPTSVTYIGKKAFGENSVLYFTSEEPSMVEHPTFSSKNIVVVPSSHYEDYLSSWAEYRDIIVPDNVWNTQVNIVQNASYSALHRAIGEEKLIKIGNLKLSGTMNSYDLMIIRNKMPNLRHLDLSDCRIVANPYEFYTGYCTQNDTIPTYAFYQMNNLLSIKLPKVLKHIGYSAFSGCSRLQQITMPEQLESLGDYCFTSCQSLDSITIPEGVKVLPSNAFYYCTALTDVKLPNTLESIESYCFYGCSSLPFIHIPDKVTTIEYGTFYGCYDLQSIHLSKMLKSIGSYAFGSCSSLRSVSITSMIERIEDYAFEGCTALDTVYTYTIEPTSINQSTFSKYAFQNATLMVPRTSYYVYFYNTQWSQFLKLKEFDQPYELVYLNNDYMLDATTGSIQGSPIVYINPTGALITEESIVQHSDNVVLRYDGSKFGTVMATDDLKALRLTLELSVNANRWYYLTFPCDVKRTEITVPGEYVVYTYDGAVRATNGSGGWKRLADDEGFKRGQGYIFQCNESGTLTTSVENPDLKGQDYTLNLNAYASTDAHNANWNFVGNPFTAYVPIQELNCTSAITVWNRNTRNYEAYSAQDDHYVLEPCQCFFVQKPKNQASITFKADSRQSYTGSRALLAQAPAQRAAIQNNTGRKVINLVLEGEDCSDKTRVVMNEEAQMNYEMECDAAKFMGDNATVQLYTIYNNVRYAINERPSDNHQVNLGYVAEKEGTYVIKKSDKVANIALFDKQTGITTDLCKSDYSFTSKVGTFDDRFVLILTEESTGIASMNPMTEGGTYYNAAGVEMGKDKQQLPAGTYLYKTGESVTKVVIK